MPVASISAAAGRIEGFAYLPNRLDLSVNPSGLESTNDSIIPCTSLVTFAMRRSQSERNNPVESNRSAGKQESMAEAIWALRSSLGLTAASPT